MCFSSYFSVNILIKEIGICLFFSPVIHLCIKDLSDFSKLLSPGLIRLLPDSFLQEVSAVQVLSDIILSNFNHLDLFGLIHSKEVIKSNLL